MSDTLPLVLMSIVWFQVGWYAWDCFNNRKSKK